MFGTYACGCVEMVLGVNFVDGSEVETSLDSMISF
jgi:hypothetical protein